MSFEHSKRKRANINTGRADLEDSYATAKLCIQAQLWVEGTVSYAEATVPTPVSVMQNTNILLHLSLNLSLVNLDFQI